MSPRTRDQNVLVRAESRTRILDSALQLFGQHGYEQTTIRMIAEAAGISQGLLYNYFAGKQDLLRELFEESIRDVRDSFALSGDEPDPQVRLERYIRGSFAILQRNLRFWKLSYHVRMQPAVLAGLGPQLAEWAAEIRAAIEGYLAALGRPSPAIEAEILFALIDGVAQHYALEPERYPLAAVVDTIVASYTYSPITDSR
jgi:AcrR family transcriptional regulator